MNTDNRLHNGMIKLFSLIFLFLIASCSKDDEVTSGEVTVSDFTVNIKENPAPETILGKATATTTTTGAIAYTLEDQTPAGALSIDASTGEIRVANEELFDFEVNPTITAQVVATAESVTTKANVTITLEDIAVSINDFTTTVVEKSVVDGTVLGMASATSSEGTIVYTLEDQVPTGSLAIDSNTGEIKVANSAEFDFDTNPQINATITATVGLEVASAALLINVTEKAVTVSIDVFNASIVENSPNETVLGTVSATSSDGDIIYALEDQVPVGTLAIDSNTGEIKILNSAAFDFETNSQITATVVATNNSESAKANVTITVEDISISISNFSTTVQENSPNDTPLGTVMANSNDEAIVYTLKEQTPAESISINSSTGEIQIQNSAAFDFETNTKITATVIATAGLETAEATVLVTIEDVTVSISDVTATISETPSPTQFLSYVEASTNSGEDIVYSLEEESVPSAMNLIQSGNPAIIIVRYGFASLYDFETNPTITAKIKATSGGESATANVTITVTNGIDFLSSLPIGTETDYPADIHFNSDGSKLFVLDGNNKSIRTFNLSTNFDISTASYAGVAEDFNTIVGGASMTFSSDGAVLYIISSSDVYTFNLSTPFNLSTATSNGKQLNREQSELFQGVLLNPTGTKLFLAGQGADEVITFNLSSAFDASTATDAGTENRLDFDSNVGSIKDMKFSNDGTKLFFVDQTGSIVTFNLTTPYDVSTGIYAGASEQFSTNDQVTFPRAMTFNSDMSKVYVLGGDDIFEYDFKQ